MSAQRFDLITASLAGAIDAWYNAAIDGDTAIITLPDAPLFTSSTSLTSKYAGGRRGGKV
jgi:hypothetical protein